MRSAYDKSLITDTCFGQYNLFDKLTRNCCICSAEAGCIEKTKRDEDKIRVQIKERQAEIK